MENILINNKKQFNWGRRHIIKIDNEYNFFDNISIEKALKDKINSILKGHDNSIA